MPFLGNDAQDKGTYRLELLVSTYICYIYTFFSMHVTQEQISPQSLPSELRSQQIPNSIDWVRGVFLVLSLA